MSKRRSNIYPRKDGRWEGRFHISGTKKYISVYGKTYSEAKEKLESLYAKNSVINAKCNCSFSEITDKWLEHTKNKIKESSFNCYSNKLKNHIMPYFADVKLSDITAEMLYDFMKEKFCQSLSAKYISDMVMIIKGIAKWANKVYGYTNNIAFVELPKVKTREPELLSEDEQTTLRRFLVNECNITSAAVILTMFTGIRIGELCGLKWGDIDLDNKIIHIRRTAQRISGSYENSGKKSKVKLCTPKTEKSVRDIPLPDFIVQMLIKFKAADEKFILSGTEKIIEPRTFTNRFKSILKKANLPSVKFHSLRHIFATNCLQKNFDIKTLSEILGHSDISTTMKIYVHTSMERKRACMDRLELVI